MMDINNRTTAPVRYDEVQSVNFESRSVLIPLRKKYSSQKDHALDLNLKQIARSDPSQEKETVILKPIDPEKNSSPQANSYPLNVYNNLTLSPVQGSLINLLA